MKRVLYQRMVLDLLWTHKISINTQSSSLVETIKKSRDLWQEMTQTQMAH